MDAQELKKIVSELLQQGRSLAEVQKILDSEHNEKITFFDLRMLASELENVDWSGQDEKKDARKEKTSVEDASDSLDDGDDKEQSGTIVEFSKLTRPGIALSGSVRFASGATAEWVLDQYGRLTFEKSEGQPTQEDIEDFQEQLKKKLSRGGAY